MKCIKFIEIMKIAFDQFIFKAVLLIIHVVMTEIFVKLMRNLSFDSRVRFV